MVNVKGTDITYLKKTNDTDKAYNVKFDRRYKYFIYKDEEDIDNKLHQIIDDYEHMDITPVLTKDNKDYILISDEKYKMIMINKSRK